MPYSLSKDLVSNSQLFWEDVISLGGPNQKVKLK